MKKKKMRNKTVSILMAMLLCVSSLTGCGSKSSDKMDKDGNAVLNAHKLILNVQSVENNAANTTHSGNVTVSGVLASAKGDVDQHTHNDAENRITSTPNGGGA